MEHHNTIRAWKDNAFRAALTDRDALDVPASPVGGIELADEDLGGVAGGEAFTVTTICATSLPCVGAVSVAISNQISCANCAESLWHGSCGFSSIGCCEE